MSNFPLLIIAHLNLHNAATTRELPTGTTPERPCWQDRPDRPFPTSSPSKPWPPSSLTPSSCRHSMFPLSTANRLPWTPCRYPTGGSERTHRREKCTTSTTRTGPPAGYTQAWPDISTLIPSPAPACLASCRRTIGSRRITVGTSRLRTAV